MHKLFIIYKEMDAVGGQLSDLERALQSQDVGRHLQGTEDLLKRHDIAEADLAVLLDRIYSVNAQVPSLINEKKKKRKIKTQNQTRCESTKLKCLRRGNLFFAHSLSPHFFLSFFFFFFCFVVVVVCRRRLSCLST
jgi:hypothetical protein